MPFVSTLSAAPQTAFLCTCPFPVLENIAFELLLSDPLGPPFQLIPLLCTCKSIYEVLCFDNSNFYARIFRCKFDHRAISRRLGESAGEVPNQAAQLKKHYATLQRIKQGIIPQGPPSEAFVDDLWTAFFMCVENDGRNSAQMEWAGLKGFIDVCVRLKLWEGRERTDGWPAESTFNTLLLWLAWFTTDQETLMNETPERRAEFMKLVRPYVIAAPRYPSFHAPDKHFELPFCPHQQETVFPYTHFTPHGLYPLYRDPSTAIKHLTHFGTRLTIAPPPITIAAKLLYLARSEVVPFSAPENIPIDRVDAQARGLAHLIAPTKADYHDWASHKAVQLADKGDWDWMSNLTAEQRKLENNGWWSISLKSASASWDNDWERWMYCYNPWQYMDQKSVVYSYGSMEGLFVGRFVVPDLEAYSDIVSNANFPSTFSALDPSQAYYPIFMYLHEHHCISPEDPCMPGGSADAFDDGIRNAWFPDSLSINDVNGRVKMVRVVDGHGNVSMYETYQKGKENSHQEEKCGNCIARRRNEEERLRRKVETNEKRTSELYKVVGRDRDDSSDGGDAERAAKRLRQSSASPVSLSNSGTRSPSTAKEDVNEGEDDTTSDSASQSTHSESSSIQSDEETDDINGNLPTVEEIRAHVAATLGPSNNIDDILDFEMGSVSDDYEESSCNGIRDIIITGETLPHHAAAWHHFRFYGRVRKWDGLIALVRVPAPNNPHTGRWIFRGYITGARNFVGSWRAWTENAAAIPWEGPFVCSRVEDGSN